MVNDFENVMGPELSICFPNLTKEQFLESTNLLGCVDDELKTDLIKRIVATLCCDLQKYILGQNKIKEQIKVEPEFDPTVIAEDNEVTLFVNINVCFNEAWDEVSDITSSAEFETFLIKRTGELMLQSLKPGLPWITAESFKVEIEGFGHS